MRSILVLLTTTVRDLAIISLIYIIISDYLNPVEDDCVAVYHGESLTSSGKRKAIDYEKYTQYREGKLKRTVLNGIECHFGLIGDAQQ